MSEADASDRQPMPAFSQTGDSNGSNTRNSDASGSGVRSIRSTYRSPHQESGSAQVISIGRRRHRSERKMLTHGRFTLPAGELIAQLQKICQRQQFRSDERIFVRDIDKIVSQMQVQENRLLLSTPPVVVEQDTTGVTELTDVESEAAEDGDVTTRNDTPTEADIRLEALLEAMDALFRHRYEEVRKLAFEIINLSLTHCGSQLTHSVRARVFEQLEDHDPGGDFEARQKTLRVLTNDGRSVEPFNVELGWLLLQWLEDSDQQRDLLNLIQNILRRSPQALDFETVIAITSVVCGRCDIAWSRGDVETCRRFLSFFHVLVTHRLERALGTSVCLRTLCWMVNADGQGTWAVMKQLLSSSAGFHVLSGLVSLLENPWQHNQWVQRGAVFFVGMSCWGSQRVLKLDEIKWAPVLLALESCLECENGVVVFEIILAIQRLVKKYGDGKLQEGKNQSAKSSMQVRHLLVEWDVILRMLLTLRPWLSPNHGANDTQDASRKNPEGRSLEGYPSTDLTAVPASTGSASSANVPVHLTRIPKELLDTIQIVVDLVRDKKFAGDLDQFYEVLQAYFVHLPESAVQLLLRYRAEAAHPAHSIDWLHSLGETMDVFFINRLIPASVREEALQLLQVNLWSSRHVCEDRVIEEVLLPVLGEVYDDPDASIRRKGLDLITEVARTHESVRFESLLDVLESAVMLSAFEETQLCAITGIVSLFSSWFDHLPHSRALRMFDIITTVAESHRQWQVRRCALECLLHVCEAGSEFRLQWRDQQVRTSRFLYCSRRAVRNQLTGAFVPVAHLLRALITLISAETHAVIFRMAVEGLRRMLNNRTILAEIDISDAAVKIISCVDYQAFGRAAIPDELTMYMEDLEKELAYSVHGDTGDDSRRRSLHVRVPPSFRVNYASVKSNVQDAAALTCKIRFATMGLEILALFVSFVNGLSAPARHHLMICIVGALDNQPVLAETDLKHSDAGDGDGSVHGESGWIWAGRPRTASSGRGIALFDDGGLHSSTPMAEAKPTSPHVAFTSRVFSKLQASTHSSNLFTALSSAPSVRRSTSNSSTTSTEASATGVRFDLELLRACLRDLYQAECTQLQTACHAISMLAHIVPDVVSARMDMVMHSAKRSFYTVDGALRADRFASVLEMAGDLVVGSPDVVLKFHHRSQVVTDVVLVAFRHPVNKAATHLAYRTLCEVVFRCKCREDRVALARAVLPALKSCKVSQGARSQLPDAAIDFLMSFALSNSDIITAPALSIASPSRGEHEELSGSVRSWIFGDAIISVEVRDTKQALLHVRRANSASRWYLAQQHQFISIPEQPPAIVPSVRDAIQGADNTDPEVTTQIEPAPLAQTERNAAHTRPARPSDTVDRLKPSSARAPWKSRSDSLHPPLHNAAAHLVEISINTPINLPVPPLPAYDGIGGSPSFFCVAPPDDMNDPLKVMESLLLNDITIDGEDSKSERESSSGEVHDGTESAISNSPTCGEDGVDGEKLLSQGSVDVDETMADDARAEEVVPRLDPLFLMMQVFDLTADDRPRELVHSDALSLGLNVLDRTPEFETHKIGVLYLRHPKQRSEVDILGNIGGSVRYLQFLRALGSVTSLEGLQGYTGGMDTSAAHNDGKCLLVHRSHSLQMVFHVATMMTSMEDEEAAAQPSGETTQAPASISTSTAREMQKKRHIGNDFVHIVFKECDGEYDVHTFSSQFNAVHIIVQPLSDNEYRTQVKCKPGIPRFGPLHGTQVIPREVVAQCVRQTCLNANLACQAFHQDLIGLTMNCEERLKQIRQLASRHAIATDEWAIDDAGC